MPTSTVWLRGIAALVGAMIVATPLSAQTQCGNGMSCNHPVASTKVSTIYRYKTVPRVSNVNRYRNVTSTSYNDITRTKYRDVRQVKYRDITRTHYVRHINRIVTVTRVHVAVIPRVHTRAVVLNQNQYVSETRMLPTRTAMAGSRTVMAGTTRVASNGKVKSNRIASSGQLKLYNMAKSPKSSQQSRTSALDQAAALMAIACNAATTDSRENRFDAAPSAEGGMTRLAFACAQEKGADVDTLLGKAGLSRAQIEDPHVRISVRSQVLFLDLVAKALGDDLLGFHLAQNFDLRMIGLLYYVLASSETLGEALGRVARYSSIVNEGFRVTVREGNQIYVVLESVGVPRRLNRHQIEFSFATFILACREITKRRLTTNHVSFVHRRSLPSEMSSFFGGDVEFGTDVDHDAFAFDS